MQLSSFFFLLFLDYGVNCLKRETSMSANTPGGKSCNWFLDKSPKPISHHNGAGIMLPMMDIFSYILKAHDTFQNSRNVFICLQFRLTDNN